jgi:DNA-binding MarR family transcriptional regulator
MSKKKGDKKSKSGKKKDGAGLSATDLAPVITQTARSMRTALSRSLVESGLYAGQDGVILALSEEDGMTPGHLANRMGVKAPTMTRTIGRMEAQGFLERRSDGTDGRLTKVHLTEPGLKSVEQIGRASSTIVSRMRAIATEGCVCQPARPKNPVTGLSHGIKLFI